MHRGRFNGSTVFTGLNPVETAFSEELIAYWVSPTSEFYIDLNPPDSLCCGRFSSPLSALLIRTGTNLHVPQCGHHSPWLRPRTKGVDQFCNRIQTIRPLTAA